MSRNLASTCCKICLGTVVLEETARPITPNEVGPYVEYVGQLEVANAHCETCNAKYLAWVRHDFKTSNWRREPWDGGPPFVDLSFRAAFNDEPAPEDLPSPEFLMAQHRKECLARAAELHEEAKLMLEEALKAERDANTGTSYWEAYRRSYRR